MKKRLFLFTALTVLWMLIVWIVWGNTALMLNEQTLTSSRIPEAFSGYRIAQISDLHNAEFGKDNEVLIDMLRQAAPDMIVITGDLIDSRRTDIDIGIRFAEKAMQIAPTYYVNGNHESRIDEYEDLKQALLQLGVVVLEDASVEITNGNDSITLIGISDPDFHTEQTVAEQLSSTIPNNDTYKILLAHRPEYFASYVGLVDLVFSGHAHGGQVRLPFIGGLLAPNQGLFPEYDAGLYSKDGTAMIVSRGIGNSLFPFRVNNRPEIIIVELQNE